MVMVDVTSGHEHDWGSFNPVYKNEIDGATKELKTQCQRSRRCIYGWDRDGYYLTPTLYYDNAQASPQKLPYYGGRSFRNNRVLKSGFRQGGRLAGCHDDRCGSRCRNCSVTKSGWMLTFSQRPHWFSPLVTLVADNKRRMGRKGRIHQEHQGLGHVIVLNP